MPSRDFKYTALENSESIRVLKLQSAPDPQKKADVLRATLKEVNLNELEEGDRYEALSWAWGDDRDATAVLNIQTSNKLGKWDEFKIKKNLADCLLNLRQQSLDRCLWVDAICINQANPEEKNRQVAIMRQIYEKATQACVWLGNASAAQPPMAEDLKGTIAFIQDRLLRRGLDQITKDGNHLTYWSHLQDIMMKPWFSRRWVIQEIALAPEATIYCGSETIPWKDFSYAASLFVDAEPALQLSNQARGGDARLARFSEISRTGAAELTELQSSLFRSSIQGPQSLATLEFLVSRLPMFECGTQHDAIYALLAVARDTAPYSGNFWDAAPTKEYLQEFAEFKLQQAVADNGTMSTKWTLDKLGLTAKSGRWVARVLGESLKQQSYPISYESHAVDAYALFMEFVIRSSGSLDMICRPWAPRIFPEKPKKPETASSAEDTEEEINEAEQHNVAQKEPPPVTLPSWIQDRHKRAFCSSPTEDGSDLMRIERREADPLVGLPGKSMYRASGDIEASLRWVRFRRREAVDHSIYVRGFIIGRALHPEIKSCGGNVPRSWLTFAGWTDKVDDPPPELCRTLVANREPTRDHAGSTPPSYYDMVCKRILTPAFHKNSVNIDERILRTEDVLEQRYLRRMRAVISERVLFKVSEEGVKGRMLAIGPGPTRSRFKKGEDAQASQATTNNSGVRKGDLICILYGCSVPVILRQKLRSEKELEQEKKHWRGEFALKFFRGLLKAQRIFRLDHAIRNEKKETLKRRQDDAKSGQSRKVKPPQRPSPPVLTDAERTEIRRKVRKEVKKVEESIKQTIQKEKKMKADEADRAISAFEELSKQLTDSLLKKHAHGTNKLGRPLPEDLLAAPDTSHPDACFGPPGTALLIPEMPAANPDPTVFYELIGECYVDGMMDGEALEARSSKSLPTEVFEIR